MKISISTVPVNSDRVLMFFAINRWSKLPTCVIVKSWNVMVKELTLCRTKNTITMRTRVLTYSQSYSSTYALSRIRYDPFGLYISMDICWAPYQIFQQTTHSPSMSSVFPPDSSWQKDRTGKQSDREAPQRPFSPKKTQEWSSMKAACLPRQTKCRRLQLLVAHQSHRPH